MKFAYSTSIFRLRPLSEAIDGIAKAGFCAVEIIADRPHAFPDDVRAGQVSTLIQCLEQRKVKVCNLNSAVVASLGDVHNPSWLEEDWQKREMRIRYTLECLRLAAALGIPCVSTAAGGRIPETMNQNDALRLFVANMHRVLPLAQKLGVKLLIDPEPDLLLETTEQTLALLKELDFHPFLGVNFDAGHFFCAGEDPCESFEKLKPYAHHIHLEDIPASRNHRHTQLGEGAIDIPAFVNCLKRADYGGYITVKLDSYDQRPEETVQASARYLRQNGFLPKRAEACE